MKRFPLAEADYEYESDDPEGFRSGQARFGPGAGAEATGASAYELPPGQSVCPYHYEYGEEEWLLVLEGEATVRTTEGTATVGPSELVYFPTGPGGAHEVRNDSDSTVRVLMFSNVQFPTATSYPDSGKVGVYTGDKDEDVIVERSSAVDYFHGEDR